MNEKVKVVFEFDRKDYENVMFMLGATNKDKEVVDKIWDKMKGSEIALTADAMADFGQLQSHIIAMFASSAVNSVKD